LFWWGWGPKPITIVKIKSSDQSPKGCPTSGQNSGFDNDEDQTRSKNIKEE